MIAAFEQTYIIHAVVQFFVVQLIHDCFANGQSNYFFTQTYQERYVTMYNFGSSFITYIHLPLEENQSLATVNICANNNQIAILHIAILHMLVFRFLFYMILYDYAPIISAMISFLLVSKSLDIFCAFITILLTLCRINMPVPRRHI